MKMNYNKLPNGYVETINRGIERVRTFRRSFSEGKFSGKAGIEKLKSEIETADAIIIGAGAGLSTSAGFVYNGSRFEKYFSDFREKYGFRDMYSGGFGPFEDQEERSAYWARYIYVNRYMDPPKPVYQELFSLVKDKDYFVITTNVDHCFQRAGFDKSRLFYTQGDFGLFQSADGRTQKTYDNEEWVNQAMEAQGFVKDEKGVYRFPEKGTVDMRVPADLIPMCPEDGSMMTNNLRSDDTFVEDEGWHLASAAYANYLKQHEGKHIVYLEIGVGMNTPVIIKYPFWQMTKDNPNAVYACLNYSEAYCPGDIEEQSICIEGDFGSVLKQLL